MTELSSRDWKRLLNNQYVQKHHKDSFSVYSLIEAHQARNYDGEIAGWKEETPEGDRKLLQEILFDNWQLKY